MGAHGFAWVRRGAGARKDRETTGEEPKMGLWDMFYNAYQRQKKCRMSSRMVAVAGYDHNKDLGDVRNTQGIYSHVAKIKRGW